jgi:hypothetical protein
MIRRWASACSQPGQASTKQLRELYPDGPKALPPELGG